VASAAELASRRCVPCTGATPRLTDAQIEEMRAGLPEWEMRDGKLTRDVRVKNFGAALALVNTVGEIAEAEGHHPDLCIHSWNRVRIDLSTHVIRGLSDNDFILAAKINEVV
jgi:4a-hydroxytetrahydrobiopterin dehydratase